MIHLPHDTIRIAIFYNNTFIFYTTHSYKIKLKNRFKNRKGQDAPKHLSMRPNKKICVVNSGYSLIKNSVGRSGILFIFFHFIVSAV